MKKAIPFHSEMILDLLRKPCSASILMLLYVLHIFRPLSRLFICSRLRGARIWFWEWMCWQPKDMGRSLAAARGFTTLTCWSNGYRSTNCRVNPMPGISILENMDPYLIPDSGWAWSVCFPGCAGSNISARQSPFPVCCIAFILSQRT